MMEAIPDIVDNHKYQLAQVLRAILAQSQNPRLDVVTAFFNLKGLETLAPEMEAMVRLRLLLGKEQEQAFVVGERLMAELEDATARGETIIAEIGRWRDFLAEGRVEIRRYTQGFCHGKAYIVHGVPALGAIGIVGSSNFTGAGLTTNRELNAVLKQASAVKELQDWFEAHWAESEDYKEELLSLLEHFTRSYTPYEIYIKVVYEALRDKLEQELAETGEKPSSIALADFQHDGYLAAREIVENYGGVLISDSVGLGKTYLALRLLDDYAYRERQTALIVCPAAVAETIWRPLLRQHAIPHEIVSMERISRRDFPVEAYARFRVIVLDESHNFRNPDTNRWPNLFRIITQGDPDKKVILLTATPVNNTVFDLYHQLSLITRADRKALLSTGISDLWDYFRRAEHNKDALYEVLEALAVRRSRQFIREHYPDAEIDGQRIRFPERELHTVRYSLKQTYGLELYQRLARMIEDLLLAPYQLETYRRDVLEARRKAQQLTLFSSKGKTSDSAMRRLQEALGWSKEDAHAFLMAVGRQAALAHILRVLYLKRLESSIESLRVSLRRLKGFLEMFLKALDNERLLQCTDYRKWLQSEISDDTEAEETLDLEDYIAALPELPAERYDIEAIRAAVAADLHSLEGILTELERERSDDKLEALKDLLTLPFLVGKKVVLFAYFKDTARYLYRELINDHDFLQRLGHRQLAIVDSNVKPMERNKRIMRFAPKANGRPDLPPDEQINLLVSTDVISEGQNLQDAEVIVNYDLHWNPVRMVQRVGRLDRIGSPHKIIHLYNFFPEEELEEILGLLARLRMKLDEINRTVGLDASVLGETPNPMDFNILQRIAHEEKETLNELEAQSELTVGEFLKQDLLHFLKKLGEEDLKRIPLGMGTARKRSHGPSGFFAAFRNPQTNQHHWLFLHELDGRIIDRRLEAINMIRCAPTEPTEALPQGFDPRPLLQKLRKHLWNKIRRVQMAIGILPAPQRQIVNWLYALPPSAERNRLLEYFGARALAGPDLKELRRLWRERSSVRQEEWIDQLDTFANIHPHPPATGVGADDTLAPEREEDIECIAWMKIV